MHKSTLKHVWGTSLLVSCAFMLAFATGCEKKAPAPAETTAEQPAEKPVDKTEAKPAETVTDEAEAKTESQPEKAKSYTIGFSQCTVTEPWRVEFNKRIIAHAKAKYPNVTLEVLDANDSSEQQAAQVRSLINRGVDAILVSPKDASGLTKPVKEAVEAGIPVVVLDRDVMFDGYDCFVGGDNFLIGKAAGKFVVEHLGGVGKAEGVVFQICGSLASTPGQERRDGFLEVVGKEAGIKVIGGDDADWKKDKAQEKFAAALQTADKIDVVYAHNDPMAHGAYQAAKQANRLDEMVFIGIDALPDEGVRWVKSGELFATFEYATPGETGLDMAVKILNGEKVDKKVTLPVRVFTKENVDKGGEVVK